MKERFIRKAAMLGIVGLAAAGCATAESNVRITSDGPQRPVVSGPQRKVESVGGNCTDVPMAAGDSREFPAGTVISGDIAVNGQNLFDSSESSALVVTLTGEAVVAAPYGADAQFGKGCITASDIATAKRAEGFTHVDVVQAP